MADKYRDRGEAAYSKVDAKLGVPARPARRDKHVSLANPIQWVRNGNAPTLWVYARLTFLLGLISLFAGVTLSLIGAGFVMGAFEEQGTGMAVSMVISGLTFSVPSALFIVGSGIIAYLAARNDREIGHELLDTMNSDQPPAAGGGSVPKVDQKVEREP